MHKSFKKLIFVFILLFLFSQIAFSQLQMDVKKWVLDNGLTILTLEDHSCPVVSFQIWYHVGSKNERPGITGISHLCEHMMFKGSKNYGPQEHAKIVQANGGVNNAWTGFDNTTYWEKLSSDKLELALKLESDRLKHLTLDPDEFASERGVVKEERRMGIDNSPYGALVEQVLNLSFVAHPYHWHVIGFMSDIDNITLDDMKAYYKTYYAPNNAIIVVAGDIETKKTLDLVKKYFGDIPGKAPPPKVGTVEPEQMGERKAFVHKIAQLPAFVVGYHIPELGHPDSYALTVAARILFKGESSRIYKKMVYEAQQALFVAGDCWTLEDAGIFFVIAGMQPGHTPDKGLDTMLFEFEKLKEKLVSEKELQKAKNQLEAEFIFDLQSVDSKGSTIGYYQTIAGDYKMLFDEAKRYQEVKAEDVLRVAKKYFDEKNRTVVILVPEAPERPGFGYTE